MKKIFLYIIGLLPLLSFAQEPQAFVVKGKVGNLNAPAKAYLAYMLGANQVVDSAAIENGSFIFKGNILNPTNATLLIDHKGVGLVKTDSTADVLNFYVDKGEITFSSADSASKAKITGSKINDDNKKLMAQLGSINAEAKALYTEQKTATPTQRNSPAFQNVMQGKYKKLQIEQEASLKMFVIANHDSYLSLLALNSLKTHATNIAELNELYNSLSPGLKNTETAKVLAKSLDELGHTGVGAVAPDFTQKDVNGVPVKLSSFKGKYVLIDFWASWCGPCRQENPNVVKAYNRYKDKNFTIIGVSLDKADGRDNWLAAIKNDGLNWTQVSDLKFWGNQAAALYYVQSIPANFLIDPAGKIIARDLRGEDLENKLAEVLAK